MYEVTEILNVSYDDSGDPFRMLDIYLPKTSEPVPALIYFHGGGIETGSRKWGETQTVKQLAESGIAVISADYRLYPNAKFPQFIEDAALAVRYAVNFGKERNLFSKIFIGGTSAGSYISMMLFFDKRYLKNHGIDPDQFDGYIFDAGQPTVHFNVLRERGLDTRLIRVDEAAPIYFVDKQPENPKFMPRLMFLVADNDMVGRYEQTMLMLKTMEHFGYDTSRIKLHLMKGYTHCAYIGVKNKNGDFIYNQILKEFIEEN